MPQSPVIARSSRLHLTPLHVDHVESFVKWFNDPDIFGQMRDMGYSTHPEEQIRWVLECNRDAQQRVFSIFHSADNFLIGNGGFINIRLDDRKAEIGLIIGEKQYWDQGLGAEAAWLLCRYGFNELHLHNIMAEHYSINKRSVHLFKKIGFRNIGTRRESRFLGGKMIDVHYSDLLPDELKKPT